MMTTADQETIAALRVELESYVPDPAVRDAVYRFMAESIRTAHAINPASWAATHRDGNSLRLNVSRVQTVALGKYKHITAGSETGEFRLALLVDEPSIPDEFRDQVMQMLEGSGRLTAAPNMVLVRLTQAVIPVWLPRLREPGLVAVRRIAGNTTRTSVYKAHHPTAVMFLQETLHESLPQPDYGLVIDPVIERIAAAIKELIPEDLERRVILEEFARQIEIANAGSPRGWATSFPDKRRIKMLVGRVQSLGPFAKGETRSLYVSVAESKLTKPDSPIAERFSVVSDVAVCRIGFSEAGDWLLEQRSAINEFLTRQLSTDKETSYRRTHNVSVVDYISREVGRPLPQPAYVDDDPPPADRWWRISAGPGGEYLDAFLELGVIAVESIEAAVDLAEVGPLSEEDVDAAFAALGESRPGQAKALWRYYDGPQPDDRIVVHHHGRVLAHGTVTGGYEFGGDDDLPYRHRKEVAWAASGRWSTADLPIALRDRLALHADLVELDAADGALLAALVATEPQPDPDWRTIVAGVFAAAGLHYSPWQQAVFVTALQTKGFVILSGISGTGKTKIAQAFAAALPQPADGGANALFVTVRPDWRDSAALLGYHNPITDAYVRTPFLDFLLRAARSWEAGDSQAFFVILDEMNLAHVEHYFVEVLSIIESGRDAGGWSREAIALPLPTALVAPDLPREVRLPPNLHIVGTVNLDETTHAFSPKVLDRAFAMELSDVDFRGFPPAPAAETTLAARDRAVLLDAFSWRGGYPRVGGVAMRERVAARLEIDPWLRDALVALNEAFAADDRLRIGYRVFEEAVAFVDAGVENGLFAPLAGDDGAAWAAFDAAATMKLLPRCHGSRGRLERPLLALLDWCRDPIAPPRGWAAGVADAVPDADALLAAFAAELPSRLPRTGRRAVRLLRDLWTDGFAAYG